MPKYLFKNCIGECPKCGSEDLSYSEIIFIEDGVEYLFTCQNCQSIGKEVYYLTYTNSVVEVEDE